MPSYHVWSLKSFSDLLCFWQVLQWWKKNDAFRWALTLKWVGWSFQHTAVQPDTAEPEYKSRVTTSRRDALIWITVMIDDLLCLNTLSRKKFDTFTSTIMVDCVDHAWFASVQVSANTCHQITIDCFNQSANRTGVILWSVCCGNFLMSSDMCVFVSKSHQRVSTAAPTTQLN